MASDREDGCSPARMVRAFHERFGLATADVPTPAADERLVHLRNSLMLEEVAELVDATWAVDGGDLVEIADALADIVYVAYGTALTYGIDLDAVLAEVHRSNMTKAAARSTGVGGKVAKGPGYSPPDVAGVLRAAGRGAG